MSYRIQYERTKADKASNKRVQGRYVALVLFMVALLAVLCFPSQLRQLRKHALPFLEPEVKQAATRMINSIQNGTSTYDAAAAFCRELIFEEQDTN